MNVKRNPNFRALHLSSFKRNQFIRNRVLVPLNIKMLLELLKNLLICNRKLSFSFNLVLLVLILLRLRVMQKTLK